MIAAVLAAALAGLAVAAWAYLRWEGLDRAAWPLVACRALALALLLLLILDLSCGVRPLAVRPLVLLDGSLSLEAAGSTGAAARDSARAWGIVRTFGDDREGDSLMDRGASRLRSALIAASAQDRPIMVVTDGELDDASDLPADLLARTRIRVFPRRALPDFAVTDVAGPDRVTVEDTLAITVDVERFGPAADSATVTLTGPAPLGSRPLHFASATGTRTTFLIPARRLGPGDHLLRATIRGPADAEPRDDARWILVRVAETPGIVLLASPPDWDSRQLYRTLHEVADLPLRGFVRLGAQWRTMDALAPVTAGAVQEAIRHADLLVIKGDASAVTRGVTARARWRWPSGEGEGPPLPGDWYVTAPPLSPIASAWVGAPLDSFPPLVEVTPIEPAARDWIGLAAQEGRRGAERPVVVGRDSGGRRELLVMGDGLWRWAFRGGASEEGYRTWVAASLSWLLGGIDPAIGRARPAQAVVPRGTPLIFERIGAASAPLIVTWTGDSLRRTDTLHFDAAGRAAAWLPVGVYGYRFADGGTGTVAVEPWSREWLPRPPTLVTRDGAEAGAAIARRAVRDRLWLFGLILAALALEWTLRRRRGLR